MSAEFEFSTKPSIMSLVNLLLDLDGTLIDPRVGICRCVQYALSKLERDEPAEADLVWCIGPPLKNSFTKLLGSSDPDLLEQALFHYRRRFSETGIYENEVYDGVYEALDFLRQTGFRIFLATSKPRIFADRILEYFSLASFFNAAYGSELDGRLSDKVDLVGHIVQRESLAPSETIIIGDRMYDVIGGRENRLVTGAVTYGYGSEDELKQAVPDFIFDSPDHLAAVLGQQYQIT